MKEHEKEQAEAELKLAYGSEPWVLGTAKRCSLDLSKRPHGPTRSRRQNELLDLEDRVGVTVAHAVQ